MLATALGLAPDAITPAVEQALYVTSIVSAFAAFWFGRFVGRRD